MAVIHCCKDCIPPKRHIGCHADCKEYIKEKAELEREKEIKKKEERPILKEFDFNKIGYANKKKHK